METAVVSFNIAFKDERAHYRELIHLIKII